MQIEADRDGKVIPHDRAHPAEDLGLSIRMGACHHGTVQIKVKRIGLRALHALHDLANNTIKDALVHITARLGPGPEDRHDFMWADPHEAGEWNVQSLEPLEQRRAPHQFRPPAALFK